MSIESLGIIGAGKLGITLAQLALKAGYKVFISGSDSPEKIKLSVDTLAPGAVALTTEELAGRAELVILAVPLSKFRQIPSELLAHKLVIDAINYWWEVDGPREEILPDEQSTSEAVKDHFSEARIVKALSHMGYHHLHDEAKPAQTPGRKAIAVAGDDEADVGTVSQVVNSLGFDPLYIGPLSEGRRLEPGSPAFGANAGYEELSRLIE